MAMAIVKRAVRSGFAIFRPPGHHAGEGDVTGYCHLNGVAVVGICLAKSEWKGRVSRDNHHAHELVDVLYLCVV